MDENTVKLCSAVLDFVSKAFWPLLAVLVVVKFRSQIETLLHRLGSVKVAGSEWVFQLPAADTPEPTKQLQRMTLDAESDGFLTPRGLREAVLQSSLLVATDTVLDELLIFSSPSQRTWIVVTKQRLLVLLDDPETRRTSRLIQTVFDKDKALPIKTNVREKIASFKFHAEGTWWFYSLDLFPNPKDLQDSVAKLVAKRSP